MNHTLFPRVQFKFLQTQLLRLGRQRSGKIESKTRKVKQEVDPDGKCPALRSLETLE
jgi:hypothetical protein